MKQDYLAAEARGIAASRGSGGEAAAGNRGRPMRITVNVTRKKTRRREVEAITSPNVTFILLFSHIDNQSDKGGITVD